ncbi:unnamed protein product [Calypogeia fissa]
MWTRTKVTTVGGIVTSEGGDDPPLHNLRVMRKGMRGGGDEGESLSDGLGSTNDLRKSIEIGTEEGKNIPQGVRACRSVVLRSGSEEGVGGRGKRQLEAYCPS